MAIHRFFILLVAALPFVPCPAAAQDMARYRSWDRNSDGIITRGEWRGTLQEFRALDWNQDGVLSGNEVWDDDQPETWTNVSFAQLDRNRDGWVSRGEWRGDRAAFNRVDRNGDNHVTRGEFMNANVDDESFAAGDFDVLDTNNNGRIERGEWQGARPTFNRLDRNGDGVLNRRELAANDAVAAVGDSFDAMDLNNNEAIARNEWRGTSVEFNRHDANRDGVISRREFERSENETTETAIRVDSRQPWTYTGVYVNAGDVIAYRASGEIQMSTNPDDRANPAGAFSGRTAGNSPRPDRRAGALLIRAGNGPVAVLGTNGTFTVQNSGELFLGVNDDHFPDNSGDYQVVLSHMTR